MGTLTSLCLYLSEKPLSQAKLAFKEIKEKKLDH